MVGIALLGAGRIGQLHAKTIQEVGASLVTVYDVFNQAAETLANKHGAERADSVEDAIGHKDAEGILIATSTNTHVELILQAIAAGKKVMCEKPIAPKFEEAKSCHVALGSKSDDVFLGFNRRFDAGHAKLRQAVQSGELGKLEQLIITSRDPSPPPLEYIPVSGGLYRDMMIHDFDMARWIVGEEIVRIHAEGSCLVDEKIAALGDVDTAVVTMVTKSGKQIVISNSRRATFGYDQRIEAFGEKGMLISDNPSMTALKSFGPKHFGAPDDYANFFTDRYGESYRDEIRNFIAMVEKGSPAPVTAHDGMMASYLAEAATVSWQTGKTLSLNNQADTDWA